MAVEDGVVHQIWGDTAGWHDASTGVHAATVSAVNMGGQWPQAMAVEDGVVHQIWGDTAGWHDASTGVHAATVSAVNMGGQWPQAMSTR
jgi:hypothetical protein